MKSRARKSSWAKTISRSFVAMTRVASRSGQLTLANVLKPARSPMLKPVLKPMLEHMTARRTPPPGEGAWIPGVAMGAAGARRFRVYRPPGLKFGERVPLIVMLHGCTQDANSFATSTRMNRVAMREGFCVLYPEQDRLANSQGCWNWFGTDSGRAYGEAGLIMNAVDQVCLLHPIDPSRVAVAGLSAGASMAALLVTRHPDRFKAVVMHSGIPPGTAHSGLSAVGAMYGHRATRPLPPTNGAMESPRPPLLVIHGDADAVVSLINGRAAAQVWADAAGAQEGPTRAVRRGRRYAMSITDFKRRGHTVSTLVSVAGLAHAWSGGLASRPFGDGQGPDASRMVWAFAARHFGR